MQLRTCIALLVARTIGAERGRAARGAPWDGSLFAA
ncbi:hypothetical protein C8N30_0118 [Sulfitobacter guttiformis]|uniref:Uncharacterized protein n=1 Tax=Sulfitobacter guttiformis TaxID=74349 RepID=A0A420DMW6_9RHOB|nr:hypothetical protein C8N30_0118 [Sulfitobacter guttiformis]